MSMQNFLTWTYGQRRGPWGVEITISERAA